MIMKYTCPTCGYDAAIWHLRLDTSLLELCENCIQDFCNAKSHVSVFELNKHGIRKLVRKCT